jgi:hypothetical protein
MSNIEHRLVASQDFPGHFALNHPFGHDISTGHSLEIRYDDHWHEGRVEYAMEYGGYYFSGDDGHIGLLKEGMIVRIPE